MFSISVRKAQSLRDNGGFLKPHKHAENLCGYQITYAFCVSKIDPCQYILACVYAIICCFRYCPGQQ